jgi:hypothetical protein
MKIELSVGEPWDFNVPDGKNKLLVESIAEGQGKYGDFLICSCKAFEYGGVRISSLLLIGRQTRQLMAGLKASKNVQINAYWRKLGDKWRKETIMAAEKDKSLIGGFFIVSGKMIEP